MRTSAAAALLLALSGAVHAQTVPEPQGYRTEAYRAPVPEALTGAEVIDTETAHILWQQGEAVFIDVLPRPPRPANLPEGTIWIDKARDTIPGATWLPNTGFGILPKGSDTYLAEGLATVTRGDLSRPLVFFCLLDCWMSWNAAKRAMLELNYTRVLWYPDGTDGWSFAGHPLETVQPWSP